MKDWNQSASLFLVLGNDFVKLFKLFVISLQLHICSPSK